MSSSLFSYTASCDTPKGMCLAPRMTGKLHQLRHRVPRAQDDGEGLGALWRMPRGEPEQRRLLRGL